MSCEKSFRFDVVFDSDSSQSDLFEKSVSDDIINGFIEGGQNVAVLAYGQTGTGKTYTIGTECKRSTRKRVC